ncbi:hypothetical protein, partial [Aeromonas hydrophila]
ATNQIAQTGLSSLPPVIYYSEQLFRETKESLVFEKSLFTFRFTLVFNENNKLSSDITPPLQDESHIPSLVFTHFVVLTKVPLSAS